MTTASYEERNIKALLGAAATYSEKDLGGIKEHFDNFVARLTEAEDAMDEGNLEPARHLIHDMFAAGLDPSKRAVEIEKGGSGHTPEEKQMASEPRQTYPRPPILF